MNAPKGDKNLYPVSKAKAKSLILAVMRMAIAGKAKPVRYHVAAQIISTDPIDHATDRSSVSLFSLACLSHSVREGTDF